MKFQKLFTLVALLGGTAAQGGPPPGPSEGRLFVNPLDTEGMSVLIEHDPMN